MQNSIDNLFWALVFLVSITSCKDTNKNKNDTSSTYKPTFESLASHTVPQWYKDAKFGIFIHWGVYAVPAYNEWFLPMMSPMSNFSKNLGGNPYTAAQGDLPDSIFKANIQEKANEYQRKDYGVNFQYDDFIPMFKAEKFNPDKWASIFSKSGAKYVVMTAKHGDEFALWPSKYDKRNSMEMGPHEDLLGAVTQSVRNQGLKMGFYINTTYSFWDERCPNTEWVNYNNNCIKELIDMYHPAIIWGDVLVSPVKDKNGKLLGADHFNSKELIAYFYNHSDHPDQILTNDRWGLDISRQDTNSRRSFLNSLYTSYASSTRKASLGKGLLLGDFETPERVAISEIDTLRKWETCDSMDPTSWGFNKQTKETEYMTSNQIIDYLADIVSKGGNLLLNIGPKADGTIPDIMKERLNDVGKWLSVNGEAIYGTKTWNIFGQGPTQGFVGSRSGAKNKYNFEAGDIRYTRRGDTLYAILLGWPEDNQITLNETKKLTVRKISMLGYNEQIGWIVSDEGIRVSLPNKPISPFANTLKIECKDI